MSKEHEQYYGKVLEYYQYAAEHEPLNPENYLHLAAAHMFFKRPIEERKLLRKVIRLDPLNAVAYNNLGLSYSQERQYKKAEALLREAIRLDPRCSCAHSNLGQLLFTKRHFHEAVACLRKAIKYAPSMMTIHDRLTLACLLDSNGFYSQSIREYKRVLRMKPDYDLIYYWLAEVFSRAGRRKGAIKYYQEYLDRIDDKQIIIDKIRKLGGKIRRTRG